MKRLLDKILPVGTRSLLWGVHQFIWHPLTVYWAWRELYGRPTWRQVVCIIVHDWGYWGKPNMDGEEGEEHPRLGAAIATRLFGPEYGDFVLLHSRHFAKKYGREPSRLCWADKLSHLYEPPWWYLFRARLSGELREYRRRAAAGGFIPLDTSDAEWFAWIQDRFQRLAIERRGDAVPYMANGKAL